LDKPSIGNAYLFIITARRRKVSLQARAEGRTDIRVCEAERDIIAVGFNLEKTFIFSDFDFVGGAFYRNVSKISRQITCSQAKATFGFTDS